MATTTPSDSHVTARERSIVTRWAALALILLLTAGGFALAYVHGTNSGRATADCVNHILGTRGAATEADSQAQREFIDETAKLARTLSVLVAAPPSQQPAKFSLFVAEVGRFDQIADHVRAVLARDQAYRNAHPLGRC